ncbi:hypothetical protein [Streptomyces sp. NPDC051909]
MLRLVFTTCHPVLSAEARAEFERAAELTRNESERALLLDRARAQES